jgi:predicted nuclease of predicted toxin-antitoxin system
MKILTDEHVPPAVANTLRSEGVDATTIYDTDLVGVNDQPLLAYAEQHDYAILTNDQHFVSKQFVEECDHCGIFFYEDQRTPRSDIVRAVHNALSVLRAEDLRNDIIYVPDGWI